MDSHVMFGFAGALGDNLCVTASAVMAGHFGHEVIGAFGGFVHDSDQAVCAGRAFVSHRGSGFDFCRRRPFGQSDKGFGAFLGVGRGAKGERNCAEARDEQSFVIDCLHIRFFLFVLFKRPFGPQL
jgi:hypothetical protein